LLVGFKNKEKANEISHAVTREYCGSPSDDEHVIGLRYMCNCPMYLISVNLKQLEICLLVVCLLEDVGSASNVSESVATLMWLF
jgi:hypothetical protein